MFLCDVAYQVLVVLGRTNSAEVVVAGCCGMLRIVLSHLHVHDFWPVCYMEVTDELLNIVDLRTCGRWGIDEMINLQYVVLVGCGIVEMINLKYVVLFGDF